MNYQISRVTPVDARILAQHNHLPLVPEGNAAGASSAELALAAGGNLDVIELPTASSQRMVSVAPNAQYHAVTEAARHLTIIQRLLDRGTALPSTQFELNKEIKKLENHRGILELMSSGKMTNGASNMCQRAAELGSEITALNETLHSLFHSNEPGRNIIVNNSNTTGPMVQATQQSAEATQNQENEQAVEAEQTAETSQNALQSASQDLRADQKLLNWTKKQAAPIGSFLRSIINNPAVIMVVGVLLKQGDVSIPVIGNRNHKRLATDLQQIDGKVDQVLGEIQRRNRGRHFVERIKSFIE